MCACTAMMPSSTRQMIAHCATKRARTSSMIEFRLRAFARH